MLKDFFSRIGIGNVKVDTIIPNKQQIRGSHITGEVLIIGGKAEQKVDAIILTLFVRYEEVREDSDFSIREKQVHEETINIQEVIEAGEHRRIPFSLELTNQHPVSNEQNETILRTTLLIPNAVDAHDEDFLYVKE